MQPTLPTLPFSFTTLLSDGFAVIGDNVGASVAVGMVLLGVSIGVVWVYKMAKKA